MVETTNKMKSRSLSMERLKIVLGRLIQLVMAIGHLGVLIILFVMMM